MSWISSWNTPATSTVTAPGQQRARRAAAPGQQRAQQPGQRRADDQQRHAQRQAEAQGQHVQQVGRQRDEDRRAAADRCDRRRSARRPARRSRRRRWRRPQQRHHAMRGRSRASRCAHAAIAPAPSAIPSSVAWPRLSVSTTIQRWCSISSTPTMARCTAHGAEHQADQCGAHRRVLAQAHARFFAMLLAQQSLRAEDQHHDQQGEGDQVAQLVRCRNADAVEEQRRADRFNHAEEEARPAWRPGCCRCRPAPRRRTP